MSYARDQPAPFDHRQRLSHEAFFTAQHLNSINEYIVSVEMPEQHGPGNSAFRAAFRQHVDNLFICADTPF